MDPLRPATASGLAVTEIVRLVAELLDDATTYSNPASLVELSRRFAGERGLAVEPGNQAADSAINPRTGVLVVERLADDHGIEVRVSSAAGLGVTLRVTLPGEPIVTEPGEASAPTQLEASVDAPTRHEPAQHAPAQQEPTQQEPIRAEPTQQEPIRADPRGAYVPPPPAMPAPPPSPNPPAPPPPSYDEPHPQGGVLDDLSKVGGGTDDTPIFNALLSRWFTDRGPSSPDEDTGRDGWESEADAGWRAAKAASEPFADELTAAGLPKRRPQAFLVPGGILPAGTPNQQIATRDADTVRRRMSSYQRGVANGQQMRNRDQQSHGPSWQIRGSVQGESHRAEGTR